MHTKRAYVLKTVPDCQVSNIDQHALRYNHAKFGAFVRSV